MRCPLKEGKGGWGEGEREPRLGWREQDLLGIDLFCVRALAVVALTYYHN